MTLWRALIEGSALLMMWAVTIGVGALLYAAAQPDSRVEAIKNNALGQECVATFKAMTARNKR